MELPQLTGAQKTRLRGLGQTLEPSLKIGQAGVTHAVMAGQVKHTKIFGVMPDLTFMGLLAPSLAALAYVHFCLEALRRMRRGVIVTLIEKPEVQA